MSPTFQPCNFLKDIFCEICKFANLHIFDNTYFEKDPRTTDSFSDLGHDIKVSITLSLYFILRNSTANSDKISFKIQTMSLVLNVFT